MKYKILMLLIFYSNTLTPSCNTRNSQPGQMFQRVNYPCGHWNHLIIGYCGFNNSPTNSDAASSATSNSSERLQQFHNQMFKRVMNSNNTLDKSNESSTSASSLVNRTINCKDNDNDQSTEVILPTTIQEKKERQDTRQMKLRSNNTSPIPCLLQNKPKDISNNDDYINSSTKKSLLQFPTTPQISNSSLEQKLHQNPSVSSTDTTSSDGLEPNNQCNINKSSCNSGFDLCEMSQPNLHKQ